MVYKISEEIINCSKDCNSSFSCLSGIKDCLCDVTEIIDAVIFVKQSRFEFCNYRMHFGNSVVCTCPVRKAIYNFYKV